jgi:hypothetical protein
MPRCSHTHADDSQCKRIVDEGERYCYSHDPSRQEERKANARKGGKRGGRSRPVAELNALRAENGTLREQMLIAVCNGIDPSSC